MDRAVSRKHRKEGHTIMEESLVTSGQLMIAPSELERVTDDLDTLDNSAQDGMTGFEIITESEYLEAVESFRPQLIEAAEQHCWAPCDAEDAVQDAILYCLGKLHAYDRNKASLKTWVTNIVIYRALNTNPYHGSQRKLAEPYRGFSEEEEAELIKNRDGALDIPKRAQTKPRPPQEEGYDPQLDRKISVQQAVAKLPERERSTVQAIFFDGYTEEEYAKQQGVTDRTVRRWLADAKIRLRELLKE